MAEATQKSWLDKMIEKITGQDDTEEEYQPSPLPRAPVAERFDKPEHAPVDMTNRYENLSNAGMVDPDVRGDFEGEGAQMGVNPEVWDRLTNLKAQQERMNSPAYLLAEQRNINRDNTVPSFIANMGSALSQVGTIGGKYADTSPLHNYANLLNKYREQVAKHDVDIDRMNRAGVNRQVQDELGLAKMQQQAHEKEADRESAENRAIAMGGAGSLAAQRLDALKNQRDREFDFKLDKRLSEFEKSMNEWRQGPGSAYGKAALLSMAADQVMAIKAQVESQPGGLDNRQAHELAIATARMVSGGSESAQSTIEALVPHSIGSKVAPLIEWLTSNPTGNNQQEFAKRMFETAEREGHQAKETAKRIKSSVMAGYQDLANNPSTKDRYEKIINNAFSTDELDEIATQGMYKKKPFGSDAKPEQTMTIKNRDGSLEIWELLPNGSYRMKPTAPSQGGQ